MLKTIYRKIIPKKIRKKIYFIRCIIFKNHQIFLVKKNSYNEDGLATNHIVDFMKDEEFIKNYHEASKGTDHKIIYRAYILNYFAEYALKLFDSNEGCFVELGTHKGLMAKVILLNSNIGERNIKFYLFDTFTGIPLEHISNKEMSHVKFLNANFYNEDVYEFIKSKFSNYPFVKIIKGILPNTLLRSDIILDNIKFLHIDLNNQNAEVESIKILYEKLSKGAPVILDDYCYSEHYRSQKDGWDKLANTMGFKILSLPTGQGLFFKI